VWQKTRRVDGYHCFYCNQLVDRDAETCPKCGRELAQPSDDTPVSGSEQPPPLTRGDSGGRGWRIGATVFSILDALVVLWFIYRATAVVNSAYTLVREGAVSAMQASQVYNEASMALLYYACIILAALLGQVMALGARLRAR